MASTRLMGTALLAGITLLSAGGATGLLLRPADAPAGLQVATGVTSAPTGREEMNDERTVKISLQQSPTPPLVIGVAGRVTTTTCRPGTALRSGRAVARIDNTPVIALATRTPLYRDLSRGSKGGDVRALQSELARLRYNVEPTGTFDRRTRAAMRDLQKKAGVPSPDGAVDEGAILWLPAPSVTPSSCELTQGAFATDGQTFAKAPARLTSVVVDSMPSGLVPGARLIEVLGVTGPLGANGAATDGAFMRKLSGTPEYRLLMASTDKPEMTGVLQLKKPLQTVKVPPGSVFAVDGDAGCVQSGDRGHRVTIVGSRLGATLVTMKGTPPEQVALGSSITMDSCG